MGIGENEKQVREMSKQQKSRGTIAQSKNFTNGCIYKRCRKRFAKLQKKKKNIYICVWMCHRCALWQVITAKVPPTPIMRGVATRYYTSVEACDACALASLNSYAG